MIAFRATGSCENVAQSLTGVATAEASGCAAGYSTARPREGHEQLFG
jgi:hypothetical protein